MRRKALLKDGEHFEVLEESEFQAEKALQEALKRNPEVLPVADLELDEVVVVGRETSLPAGSVDLLLVDSAGRVLIVETKLSQNPDLRRQVVAQLLDYGASLWRTASSLKQFRALVLRYWQSPACEDAQMKDAETLRDGLEPRFKELCGEEWDYETFEAALEENLANGRHVFLIVARGLMDGLSGDLLRYADVCLNIPLYGVEIDVFETASRQLIVPRGVRYTPRRPPTPSRGQIDRTIFLSTCTPVAATFFEQLLNQAEEPDVKVDWYSKGFSVRKQVQSKFVTLMYGYPPDQFQVYTAWWPVPAKSLSEFVRGLRERAPSFVLGKQAKHTYRLQVTEKTQNQAYAALAFAWNEVERMMGKPEQSDAQQ